MRGRGETARGTVHFLAGACALTLKWLSVPAAATSSPCSRWSSIFSFCRASADGASFGGARGGGRSTPGSHLYPIAVLILILVFGRRMEVVVAAWLIMAAGDPAARMVGLAFGRRQAAAEPGQDDRQLLACAARPHSPAGAGSSGWGAPRKP